jgi:hypothetical protein
MLTCVAGYPSIITMGADVASDCSSRTLQEPPLSSIATHITKPDRTTALTKYSIASTLSTYNKGEFLTSVKESLIPLVVVAGADPEILHGRWLMGWLPIVNYTGARGVAG